MRRLRKGQKPNILLVNETAWTAEYMALADRSRWKRWGHAEVKAALARETHGLCAYCESVLGAITDGHVEHVVPRVERPDLAVTWTNLTLACPKCNGAKLDYYQVGQPLLDPYRQMPDRHLIFVGAWIYSRSSVVGERTIRRLRLVREGLVQSREKHLSQVHGMWEKWDGSAGADKEMWAGELRRLYAPGAEFSAATKAFLQTLGFPT